MLLTVRDFPTNSDPAVHVLSAPRWTTLKSTTRN